MATELTDRQARNLRIMLAGVPLAHYVDDDSWHLLRSDRAEPVPKSDAALFRRRGWVERVGYEESVPMEVYTLTRSGRTVAARTPEVSGMSAADADDPLPVMVMPIVWATHEPPGGWGTTYVEIPLTEDYLELLTTRQRLAEYLAAVESDFDYVHFNDMDARVLSVENGSASRGALSGLASEDADFAFLSSPLDTVRDMAAEVHVHDASVSMVVGPVTTHWQVDADPDGVLGDDSDGSMMLTTAVLPDEVSAAAREFIEEGRESSFDDDPEEDADDDLPGEEDPLDGLDEDGSS